MGKFLLYRFFHKNTAIAPYLPETRRYSERSLRDMLRVHSELYVKPVAGSRGRGIIKVWKTRDNHVVVKRTTEPSRRFSTVGDAVKFIDKLREGKAYIVQKGIRLARIHGRPFDIRVMVQRDKPGGRWLYSGMVAKVAGAHSIVTNTALSRGTVMGVGDALAQSLGWDRVKCGETTRRLEKLGLEWARHFDSYQLYRELGFDVAVDTSGRIWLIEQNTAPSHALFARLKSDLRPYRRIQYRWGVFERAKRGARQKRKQK